MTPPRITRTATPDTRRPTLPPRRAFVVQIHASVEAANGTLTGRVEHLASGSAIHFTDATEVVAFVRTTLTNLREENHPHE